MLTILHHHRSSPHTPFWHSQSYLPPTTAYFHNVIDWPHIPLHHRLTETFRWRQCPLLQSIPSLTQSGMLVWATAPLHPQRLQLTARQPSPHAQYPDQEVPKQKDVHKIYRTPHSCLVQLWQCLYTLGTWWYSPTSSYCHISSTPLFPP
jgi:hypothetical protein